MELWIVRMLAVFLTAFSAIGSATTAEAAKASARAVQSQASPAAVPLSVLSTQVDPSSATVTFTLDNTGSQPITAWDVAIVVGVEPEARHGGYGVDAFRLANVRAGRAPAPLTPTQFLDEAYRNVAVATVHSRR
jgi:hypothetical protein